MNHKSSLLILATLALSGQVLAQVQNPIAATSSARPGSIKIGEMTGATNFLNILWTRIGYLDIQGQVQDMEKAGVKERKFVAAFTASGALMYNHELSNQDISQYTDTGANVGLQIVPYTVKYATNGAYYLAVNPVSLRNMNTLQSGSNSWDGMFFRYVDNMDALVVKWDKNMAFDSIKSFQIDFLSADLKFDILNAKKETRYLALTAGGSFGISKTDIRLDDGTELQFRGKNYDDIVNGQDTRSNTTNLRYGLEYADRFENGMKLKIGVSGSHTNTAGAFDDRVMNPKDYAVTDEEIKAYDTSYKSWDKRYLAWYDNQNCSDKENCLTSTFESKTGDKRPVKPGSQNSVFKANRRQIYVIPSIELSKRLSTTGRPVSVGARMSANLPVVDQFSSDKLNLDLSGRNRNLVNATIFLNF